MSLRDTILSAKHRSIIPLEVHEWGVTVSIRPLSVRQRTALEGKSETEMQVSALVDGLVDDDGSPIFTATDRDLILDTFDGRVVERVALAVLRANTPSVAELEKNSEAPPSVNSLSS